VTLEHSIWPPDHKTQEHVVNELDRVDVSQA